MITAVDEQVPLVYVLLNDQAHGLFRNIDDAQCGRGRHSSERAVSEFGTFAPPSGWRPRVAEVEAFGAVLAEALQTDGPQLIEVDMRHRPLCRGLRQTALGARQARRSTPCSLG